MGGLTGAVLKGDLDGAASGAIGAIVGEMVAEGIRDGTFTGTPLDPTAPDYGAQSDRAVDIARFTSAATAVLLGGDADTAAFTAENAARYNCLSTTYQETRLLDEQIEAAQTEEKRAALRAYREHVQKGDLGRALEAAETPLPDPVLAAIAYVNGPIERAQEALTRGAQICAEERSRSSSSSSSSSSSPGVHLMGAPVGHGLMPSVLEMAKLPTTYGGVALLAVPGGSAARTGTRALRTGLKSFGKAAAKTEAPVFGNTLSAEVRALYCPKDVPLSLAKVKAMQAPSQRIAANSNVVSSASSSSSSTNATPSTSRVRLINDRRPINSELAGKVYPLEKLPEELRRIYPHSVPFTGTGHPDFSRYATKKVKIDVTGKDSIDFALADKAAGFSKRPSEYTWHHHHDGESMYLVPKDIHNAVRHTGGRAIVKGKKK